MSGHWTVERVDHLYDEGIAAGSDHAVVVADFVAARVPDIPSISKLTSRPAIRLMPADETGPSRPRDTDMPPDVDNLAGEFIPGRYCCDCGWPFPVICGR